MWVWEVWKLRHPCMAEVLVGSRYLCDKSVWTRRRPTWRRCLYVYVKVRCADCRVWVIWRILEMRWYSCCVMSQLEILLRGAKANSPPLIVWCERWNVSRQVMGVCEDSSCSSKRDRAEMKFWKVSLRIKPMPYARSCRLDNQRVDVSTINKTIRMWT